LAGIVNEDWVLQGSYAALPEVADATGHKNQPPRLCSL